MSVLCCCMKKVTSEFIYETRSYFWSWSVSRFDILMFMQQLTCFIHFASLNVVLVRLQNDLCFFLVCGTWYCNICICVYTQFSIMWLELLSMLEIWDDTASHVVVCIGLKPYASSVVVDYDYLWFYIVCVNVSENV